MEYWGLAMTESAEIDKLGWAAIAKAQPTGTLPAWIVWNSTNDKKELRKGLWELVISLFKKRELRPGESWELKPDGTKILVWINPASGEKRVVISYEAEEGARVDLFRVEVDLHTKRVTIQESALMRDLDPDIFDLPHKMDTTLEWP